MKGTHKKNLTFLNKFTVLFCNFEILRYYFLCCNSAKADNDFRPDYFNLLTKPPDADILLLRLRVTVFRRSAFQHIPDWYKDSLLQHYEDTYFPEHMENAGRASYVERNQEMINHSKFCVVYYDENYLPPRRKNSRRDLFDYQPKSGTAVAYNYAVRKKKEIINVFKY